MSLRDTLEAQGVCFSFFFKLRHFSSLFSFPVTCHSVPHFELLLLPKKRERKILKHNISYEKKKKGCRRSLLCVFFSLTESLSSRTKTVKKKRTSNDNSELSLVASHPGIRALFSFPLGSCFSRSKKERPPLRYRKKKKKENEK